MRMPPDSLPTSHRTSSGTHPHGTRWRMFALAFSALVVVVAGSLILWVHIVQPHQISSHRPPYLFTWSGDAPGTLTAREAYQRDARVMHTSDGTVTTPVATLWIAESKHAALALAQLASGAPDAHHLALVTLERTGRSAGTWQGSGGSLILGNDCAAMSDYCIQQTFWTTNHTMVISSEWSWSTPSDANGLAEQFSQPLTQRVQGGMLAGTTYYAASQPLASGGTLVVIGTGNQAAINAAADWITRDAPRHESGPSNR